MAAAGVELSREDKWRKEEASSVNQRSAIDSVQIGGDKARPALHSNMNGTLINTGHDLTFQVDDRNRVNLTGGPLSYLYRLQELRLHYGSIDSQGSEHSVDGYSFPGEFSEFCRSGLISVVWCSGTSPDYETGRPGFDSGSHPNKSEHAPRRCTLGKADPSRETCWFRFGCLQRAAGDLVTLKFRLDYASPPGAALVRQLKTAAVGDNALPAAYQETHFSIQLQVQEGLALCEKSKYKGNTGETLWTEEGAEPCKAEGQQTPALSLGLVMGEKSMHCQGIDRTVKECIVVP
ncbi:Carbonic anhydrase- protein 10 [Branchiostoma belcheri]|nr:Carbonic anhydrase- protein 10 [Branchiostoma belcheri]